MELKGQIFNSYWRLSFNKTPKLLNHLHYTNMMVNHVTFVIFVIYNNIDSEYCSSGINKLGMEIDNQDKKVREI